MLNPFFLSSKGIIVFLGYPTSGMPPSYTRANSPLSGPKEMLSSKVGDLNTGHFATMMPTIDGRQSAEFRSPGDTSVFVAVGK